MFSLQQDLAVIGDLDGRARNRETDRPDGEGIRAIDGRTGSRLRQAITLEDGDADSRVEVAEPRSERGSTGDGPLRATTEQVTQLAVHQPVKHAVEGLRLE